MDMQAVVVRRIGAFSLETIPRPTPKADELLVRVDITGLCRTDLKLIRDGHRDLVMPRVPGEEVVGTVAACGSAVTDFSKHDIVYAYPGIWCGACPACLSGAENLCRAMRIMGFHRDGGFAEFVAIPSKSAIRVPPGLSAEEAVFAEPLSCCLNALELGGVQPGMRIGIWGAGPAGTLLHRAAKAHGASPVNIDPDERRRERIGGRPSAAGDRFDIAVVAVGAVAAYEEALAALAPRGRLVVFSGLRPAEAIHPLNLNTLHYEEQSLVGAYGCSYRHGIDALNLLSHGDVAVADLISHRLPLSALDDALALVERRAGMKILLYPQGGFAAHVPLP